MQDGVYSHGVNDRSDDTKKGMMGNWASGTYWASESSVSDTAGTMLNVGKTAGRTTVRPLWITSITYLRNNSYVRHATHIQTQLHACRDAKE